MRDRGGIVLALAAILAMGMMIYIVSLSGLGPSDIVCWLELACR